MITSKLFWDRKFMTSTLFDIENNKKKFVLEV